MMLRTSWSAAGSSSLRPVTSSWQNSTIPLPARYSSKGLYCRLKPPSSTAVKSPQAGFSISTEARLPRQPQRHSLVTSMPHQLTVGAPLKRGLRT